MLRPFLALDHPDIAIGKITVCRSCFFIIGKMKRDPCKAFRLLSLTADIRLKVDPLRNAVTRKIHINDRRLPVRVDTTPILDIDKIRLLHQFTTARDRYTCIVYQSQQITAMMTVEKPTLLHPYPFLSKTSLLSCP